MRKIFFIAAMLLSSSIANAEVKLPNIIGSNMVLQQNTQVRLWGTAEKNSKVEVKVSWDNNTFTTQSNKEGKFEIKIPTQNSSFDAQTITFTDTKDKKSTTLNNILIGEVWLASGQSNMQMPLKGFPGCFVKDGWEEIMNSKQEENNIRFFSLPTKHSYQQEEDIDAKWTVPCPEAATEYSATAWHYAKSLSHALNCPVGIVNAAYGGTKVESWLSKELLESYGLSTKKEDIENTTEEYLRILLPYNAMFWPVHNFTYKGIIWYQGCSNVGEHKTFLPRMKDLIKLWREKIDLGNIPFYMVEIAPYNYGSGDAPFLREAQYKVAQEVENCGIISTSDLVLPQEYYNIHPRNKKEVGQRLAFLSLNKTYNKGMYVYSGPTYKEIIIEKSEAFIGFDNIMMGICSNYMLEGFEIAGEDRVFHKADSVWVRWQTNHVAVSSKKVEKPVAVRYCFKDFAHGNLYGGAMMPAFPFRTDNWDDVK